MYKYTIYIYVCVCKYIHTYVYIYIQTYIYTYIYIYIHTYIYIYIYTYLSIYTELRICIYIYMMYVCKKLLLGDVWLNPNSKHSIYGAYGCIENQCFG